MSYVKKFLNKKDILEVYYTYGDSDNFDQFRGGERWFLNKKTEYFSNDRCLEIDGEYKNGSYIGKYLGLQKRKHLFENNGIGSKK